ncbi:hypothetical protein IAQ61_003051 [Plenodomus lingam]|nr:hypothetical protein IAQ61_003051 [Plenodomus lingam]
MFSPQNYFVIWLASSTAQAVILHHGDVNVVAPFSNVSIESAYTFTTLAESVGLHTADPTSTFQSIKTFDVSEPNPSKSTTTELPPIATVISAAALDVNATSTASRRTSNASCIVNIPSANLEYWHPPTYSHAVGTMTTEAANFSDAETLTLVPQKTAFDVTSALATDYACTTRYSYMSVVDWTFSICIEYTEKPVATVTSIAYRYAYSSFPVGNTAPVADIFLYDLYTNDRTSATTTLSVAPNVVQTQTSNTPFVHFTEYEIESGGRTETFQLQSGLVYPYWLEGIEQQATATGPLPKGFIDQISQSHCNTGKLQAVITVVIVVDLYYQFWPDLNPFLIHFESTALGFEDPPVIINHNNQESSSAVSFTIVDWDLTSLAAKPIPTNLKPQVRPNPVSITANRAHDSNENNHASQEPQIIRVTVGNVGTFPVVVGPSSQVMIGSQTLQPGAAPVIIGDGTRIALAPSATAIIIGDTTSQLPRVLDPGTPSSPLPPPILTLGSLTFTPNAATQFLIAPDQTLIPGGVVTLDGTKISLASSAAFVVIGTSTEALQPAVQAAAPVRINRPKIIVAGSTIIAEPIRHVRSDYDGVGHNDAANGDSGPSFIVSGQTLAPGGSAITVSGTVLSLAASGSFVVVNGVSSSVSTHLNPPTAAHITAPPLTIGDRTFYPLPGTETEYLIFSMLLTPGGSIVVAGTTVSLALGVSALVVNGHTSHVALQAQAVITNAPLLTIGTRTYTAVHATTFIIDGKTLTPGGVITVDGTTITLAHGATALVYGSAGHSTSTALFPATTTQNGGPTCALCPGAAASGGDARPMATSSQEGAAVRLHTHIWTAALVVCVFLSIRD